MAPLSSRLRSNQRVGATVPASLPFLGDPKLSGAIHPHRAPGYENRKPKHQREDGSYPEVRLLKAERRECIKALALSSQIDAEYQRQAALKAQQPERSKAKPALELAAASGSAIDLGWAAGFLLLTVAAAAGRENEHLEGDPDQLPGWASIWLPYEKKQCAAVST